jgi:threonine/homoserine/homoserine lactone efflux protein
VASEQVFHIVKLAGANYLIYLGTRRALRRRAALRQGILTNLGNPKMAVFFASVVIFSALTCAWLCLYAATVSALGPVLARSRVRRTVDGVAGAVLIGLGVRVATEAR